MMATCKNSFAWSVKHSELTQEVDSSSYFNDVMTLLAQYPWLYNFQLTHLFRDKILEKIPEEWSDALLELTVEEINQVPFGYFKESWPQSLKHFLDTAIKLSLPRTPPDVGSLLNVINQDLMRGMSPKKRHEVECIAALVDTLCKDHGCKRLVDVGSGLGYLSLVLSHQYDYNVLGIECEQSRCQGADLRASKLSKDKLGNFSSIPILLKDEKGSTEHFQRILRQHFSKRCDDKLDAKNDYSIKENQKCKSCCRDPSVGTRNIDTYRPIHGQSQDKRTESNKQYIDSNTRCHLHCDCVTPQCTKLLTDFQSNCDCCNDHTMGCGKESSSSSICMRDSEEHHAVEKPPCACDYRTQKATPPVTRGAQNDGIPGERGAVKDVSPITRGADVIPGERGAEKDATPVDTVMEKLCLLGLHSCGDLTATMLRLFAQMEEFVVLVTFSCCYHRLTPTQEGNGEYEQFPMSQCLREVYRQTRSQHPGWCLSSFALRLAAQETRSRWKQQDSSQHLYHQNNVAFRGLLDLVLSEDVQFHKDKRKFADKLCYTDFDTYLKALLGSNTIKGSLTKEQLHDRLKNLYEEQKNNLRLIEPFTCLQVVLQGVLESLILVDRVTFLQEQGLIAKLMPVMDDYISPRNIAIISWK